MKTIINDPLLTIARVATWLVQIAFIIGQIGLGVAIAATIAAALGLLPQDAVVEGIEHLRPEIMWPAALAMALVMVALGMATQFVVRLRQIIDTVGEGDPFQAANGERLTRMAWLALIGQILAMIAGAIGGWIHVHGGHGRFDLDVDVSLTGFFIAVLLFILARVFRKGAEMRDELEGTV
jgi:MFS family permease